MSLCNKWVLFHSHHQKEKSSTDSVTFGNFSFFLITPLAFSMWERVLLLTCELSPSSKCVCSLCDCSYVCYNLHAQSERFWVSLFSQWKEHWITSSSSNTVTMSLHHLAKGAMFVILVSCCGLQFTSWVILILRILWRRTQIFPSAVSGISLVEACCNYYFF